MSATLATAATLLALIFSAPVLCANTAAPAQETVAEAGQGTDPAAEVLASET